MKAIFVFILKAGLIALWMITCFYICNKPEGLDMFMYWVLCGFPFGITKMTLVLAPKNFGLAGGVGVLALNALLGGIIGGFILLFTIIKLPITLVKSFE